MSSAPPPQPRLSACRVSLKSSAFRELQAWNYPTDPFYVNQVHRMLLTDVPHLVVHEGCMLFGYRDRNEFGSRLVGFGTLQVTSVYSEFCDTPSHCYIPVLSVNPEIPPRGYGREIVDHLIEFARDNFVSPYRNLPEKSRPNSNLLFLDVYSKNQRAIKLYDKSGFVALNPNHPIADPDMDNETYLVMAKPL